MSARLCGVTVNGAFRPSHQGCYAVCWLWNKVGWRGFPDTGRLVHPRPLTIQALHELSREETSARLARSLCD